MTDDTRTDGHVGRYGITVVNGPEGEDGGWRSVDWAQAEDDEVGRYVSAPSPGPTISVVVVVPTVTNDWVLALSEPVVEPAEMSP